MEVPAEIHVVVGTIADSQGRVLIAQRPRGRHMAGRWEFPGGKLGAGEDPLAGLSWPRNSALPCRPRGH